MPPSGDTVRPDEIVVVIATATPSWSCPADAAGRVQAWAFLRFLVSGSARPHLAPEVRLYVDGEAAGTADGTHPATSPDWRWRVRDPVVAYAVRPVANDLGQPVVSITRGSPPPTTCGVPTPSPSGVAGAPTRIMLTASGARPGDGPGDGPELQCQLTIDLFEDDDGAIAVVSVTLPGGGGLGPPPLVGPATTGTHSTTDRSTRLLRDVQIRILGRQAASSLPACRSTCSSSGSETVAPPQEGVRHTRSVLAPHRSRRTGRTPSRTSSLATVLLMSTSQATACWLTTSLA